MVLEAGKSKIEQSYLARPSCWFNTWQRAKGKAAHAKETKHEGCLALEQPSLLVTNPAPLSESLLP
jgi:hypothetical protein